MRPWSSRAALLWVLVSIGLVLAAPKPAAQGRPQSAAPGITVHAPQPGTASPPRVTWSAGQADDAIVFVTRDGGAERLFARGSSGAIDVPWIQPASVYQFRLYAIGEPRRQLGTAYLELGMQVPIVEAEPNPIPYAEGPGATVLTWNAAIDHGVRLEVIQDGGPPTLVSTASAGSARLDWIQPASIYEFQLLADSRPTALARVTVSVVPPERRIFRLRWIVAILLGAAVVLRVAHAPVADPASWRV